MASTADNAIYAIHNAEHTRRDAGTGKIIYQDSTHLHGPLALVLAPNGDLIASNGDAVNADPNQPSELVEFTQHGKFVSQFQVDPIEKLPYGAVRSGIWSCTFFARPSTLRSRITM